MCLAVSIILFFAPNLYLLLSSGTWNGRQAVCGTPSTGVQPNDLEYTALEQIIQNPVQGNASEQVLTTGNLIYSSGRETFYLQDGIFILPVDTSDCQGLDIFKSNSAFVVASGIVTTDNGDEFLAANSIASTVPNWVTNLVVISLFVALGLIIGFITLIVQFIVPFFRWLFTRIGIRKPKPAVTETKETKDKLSRWSGVLSILLSIFAPIFWFFSFVVGAATQIFLLIYAWRVLKKFMRKTAVAVMILCGIGLVMMTFIFIGTRGFSATSTTSSATYAVSSLGRWMAGGMPSQEPLETEPYASSTLGFSIHQPEGWIASSTPDMQGIMFVGPVDGSVSGEPHQPKFNVAIISEPSLASSDTGTFVDAFAKSFPQQYKNFSLIAEENHTLDGGRLAAEYFNATYTNASGTAVHLLALFTIDGGRVYIAGSEIPVDRWSRYEQTIRASLGTFDLVPTTYTNSKTHISIAIPLHWSIDESGTGGTAALFRNSEPDFVGSQPFYANINIIYGPAQYNDHRDIDSTVQQIKNAMPEAVASYSIINEDATTTNLGESMYLLEATFAENGMKLHNLQAITVGRNDIYEITATALASTWSSYEFAFMNAIRSLQVAGPTNLGNFVTCLNSKNAFLYGLSGSSFTEAQKRLLGDAADHLLYVNCKAPEGPSQTSACDAISGFPTWEFADGSKLAGEQNLPTLAQKTGCQLPTGQ